MRVLGRMMLVVVAGCVSLGSSRADAAIISFPLGPLTGTHSFSGTFTADNDIALVSFTVTTTTLVTADVTSHLQTPAGFDPVLTLFGTGTDFMGAFDFLLDDATGTIATLLAPGNYLLAVTQYSNFYVPFQNRFDFDAAVNGAYTKMLFDPLDTVSCSSFVAFDFNTQTSQCRTGSFDGTVAIQPAPEPATLTLLALGAAGLARRRRRAPARKDSA